MFLLKFLTFLILVEPMRMTVISTVQGKLRGVLHNGYVSYEGIPYATVTGTMERFKRAGLAPIWRGVRESHTPRCLSTSDPEDCLKLDVHVPLSGSRSWPVLVWVAGGSGYYNSSKLVRRGMVLVIVHHRHGPQGFLCLTEDKIPGNAGVKDLILALRWIRDNIVAFRGNPTHIVLAGQSFGAAMVDAVLLSPMSDGLYHGAILQSGSILAPWAFNYDAKTRATVLANLINDNANHTVTAILHAKMEDLVSKLDILKLSYIPFGMCKELPLKKEEPVLLKAPIDLKVKSHAVPLIIGFNSEEAYIFSSVLKDSKLLKRMVTGVFFLLPEELRFLNERETEQVSRQIKDMYFEGNTSMSELLAYHRDAYFMNHVYRSASVYASVNTPVYLYRFSHVGKLGVAPEPGVEKSGAAHTDELGYLFPTKDLNEDDSIVQDNVLELWSNFVKYLNPNQKESIHWETLDLSHPRLLDITTELKMIDFPYTRSARMWNEIYDKYYYNKNRIVP